MKGLSWRTEISENHQWKLVINNPISLFTLSHSLTNASVDKQVGSYPGLQMHQASTGSVLVETFLRTEISLILIHVQLRKMTSVETLNAPN